MNIANPSSFDLEKLYTRNVELNDETEIIVYQSEIGDVGCVVWDAALVLCKYLETDDFEKGEKLKGKTVLELGAGTGAVGLVAAALGAHSVVTDLPQFVPLMQHNISANENVVNGTCEATALTWGKAQDITDVMQAHCSHGIDYILVADCVYYDEVAMIVYFIASLTKSILVKEATGKEITLLTLGIKILGWQQIWVATLISIEPLVQTIKAVSCAKTTVLCCYEDRDVGNKTVMQNKFFKMAEEFFNVVEIPDSSQDAQFKSPDIHIMKMTQKQNTSS